MWVCVSLILLAVLPIFAGPRVSQVGPGFASRQHTALVARVGDSVALRCRVLHLADRALSWVRSSDLQILTHAGAVFTADSRVSCFDASGSDDPEQVADDDIMTSQEDWEPYSTVHSLRIERLRLSDSGRYECQINTEPKLSLFFNLTVIDSSLPVVSVSPVGASEMYSAVGGVGHLACEARYVTEPGSVELPAGALAALPPLRVRWEHRGNILDPQSSRGGISLETERWPGRSVSRLTLAQLSTGDAGRYTCTVHGASASLHLHLSTTELDADEQYDVAGPRVSQVGPGFASRQHTALVARVGDSVALRCRVLHLADRALSWVRSSDLQILTHAGAVFTADSRVSCFDASGSDDPEQVADDDIMTSQEDWEPYSTVHSLRIERLRLSDSGRYECQINTEPKLSLFFNLTVIDSSLPVVSVSPVGASEMYSAVGGVGHLACEARYVTEPGSVELPAGALAALPPLRVRWEHRGNILDPQSSRGGISLETERWPGRSVSRLTLAQLSTGDAGRYTCTVHGASASLHLHLSTTELDADEQYDVADGEMESMQRDQAVARVSSAIRERPREHLVTVSLTFIVLASLYIT